MLDLVFEIGKLRPFPNIILPLPSGIAGRNEPLLFDDLLSKGECILALS